MPSKKEGFIVLYPEYFDKALTRAEGRRVPRKLAVSKPTTKMLSNAARKLGIPHKVEDGSHFSGRWYEKRGRVLITSGKAQKEGTKNKTEIIALIAERLKAREERTEKK